MSDLGLTFDSATGRADLSLTDNDLTADDGLETAVLLSLFTDARAEDGDTLPDSNSKRQGWWGDTHPPIPADKHGSKLWLLQRSKQTPDVVRKAKDFAREALQWLIDDKVATKIDVESGIVAQGILGISVRIYRPNTDPTSYRFNYEWAAQEARRA